jgi:D-beta-D-heptose 7-phosphate kinase/D-beta-D-heptose 1-phosphate adenosyltransferase
MTPDACDLLSALDSLGQPRVLVLGDLMLDRYTFGDAERVSQEAPVLVLRADQQEARLGGAASVCQLLRGLDAQVSCIGLVGDDSDGRDLREMLGAANVDQTCVFTDASRPTTTKQRFIGRAQNRHPHQILRVDREVRTAANAALEKKLLDALVRQLQKHRVLLISDYGKGVCSPSLLRNAIGAAWAARVPVLVDPIKISDYSRYKGATVITPNRSETEAATGIAIKHARDAVRAGAKLCRELNLKASIVTLDRDGMALVPPDGGGVIYPTRPRSVYDITGAGDMVLATLGVSVAAGHSLVDAVKLANVAGGLEVEKVGVVPVTRDEIRADLIQHSNSSQGKVSSIEELAKTCEGHRLAGRKIVFTNGCFDLLHVGHVTYLEQAAAQGDVLIVGVNSDLSVRQLKGPTRPITNEQSRAAMLAGLQAVDHVVVFGEDTPLRVIEKLRPDVLVKGGDYKPEEIVGREFVESYGGQVCALGLVEGVSTTRILNTVAAGNRLQGPHFRRSPSVQSVDRLAG